MEGKSFAASPEKKSQEELCMLAAEELGLDVGATEEEVITEFLRNSDPNAFLADMNPEVAVFLESLLSKEDENPQSVTGEQTPASLEMSRDELRKLASAELGRETTDEDLLATCLFNEGKGTLNDFLGGFSDPVANYLELLMLENEVKKAA